jgi:ABC-type tungstate transport system permease subunit
MSEEQENYAPTPSPLNIKYRSNPNYEVVRMGVISLLNTYDPASSIIDNREQVTAEAISIIKQQVEHARELLSDFKEDGLSLNCLEAEGYLRGCLSCQNHLEEYL